MWPPVTRFAAAFTAGLWTGVFFSVPVTPIVIVATIVVTAGSAWGWRQRMVGAFLVGAGAGAVAALQHHGTCAQRWSPGRYAAVVRVHDAPGARRTTTASVLHTRAGCEGDIRLRLDSGAVEGGATVVVVGSVRANGWFRVEHLRPLAGHERQWRFRIRGAVGRRIRRLFGPRAPLVEAMVLGRRSDLDPAVRDQFVGGGLAHLLAISGLHVGIIVGHISGRRTTRRA